jgi:MHS family proline/betaine transporter-like MFS transporter
MEPDLAGETPAQRRALVTACVANTIEWYDFAVYGALASVLAVVLVPPGSGGRGLIAIYAVFASSFVARPVGAVLSGMRADRFGRRRILATMVAVMAAATCAIGLLPPWSRAGALVPATLLGLRLIQGFASGGEVVASVPFLVESAPVRRRGLYGGWHTATLALGVALGLGGAALVTATMTEAQLQSWGWRLPFLVALPLGAVALYVVRRLPETPAFLARSPSSLAEVRRSLRAHRSTAVNGFVLVAVLAGTFNMWFVYLPTHVAVEDAHTLRAALACACVGLLGAAVAAPAFGRLSDRVGRRPLLVGGTVAMACLATPAYALAVQGSTPALLVADVGVAVAVGALVLPAHIAESFPVEVRASGIAASYGLASATVGGTAPLVGAALTRSGHPRGIPVYLCVLALAGVVAATRSRETLPTVRSGGPTLDSDGLPRAGY